jgi:16S rRNA C967 or C1407 C5-methylase (RsmB/RsmF family)/NOL1/NOP2/fmu family ribosome biogenesis protein
VADLPPLFLERMAGLLGDEYPDFLAALGRPALQALRANALKTDLAHLSVRLGLPALSLPWCPEALLLPSDVHLGHHPFHAAGLFYLQEPSATAAVPVLDPQPGERVLDLCAAPGGKATHIAARLQGRGLLWANEVDPRRAALLLSNLERFGVHNAIVSAERPERLAERLPAFFDRVLVDAPCSGEGLFRREPESVREWSPSAVHGCARRQEHILEAAARLIRPGGALLYATCTFAPEEDEGVVGHFLESHPDFALEEVPAYPGFSPGRPEWAVGVADSVGSTLACCVRLWPHRAPGEGHFLACLRRGSSLPLPPGEGGHRGRSAERRAKGTGKGLCAPPMAVLAAYASFCREALRRVPVEDDLALLGERLLALPEGMPNTAGLRLLRAGWLLGQVRGQRFVPSHALAMGLAAGDAQRELDLPIRSDAVAAYLRGEPLPSRGPAGWLLVTVEGNPVGWGKRVGGVVKNHRPRGAAL